MIDNSWPIEIETVDADDETQPTSTYIFDIHQYMMQGQACTGIVLALSNVLKKNPNEMQPLASAVDCDALNRLFYTRRYGDLRTGVSVTFPYDVYEVTAHASGRVVIHGTPDTS